MTSGDDYLDNEPGSSEEWERGKTQEDDDNLVDPKDVEPEDNPFDRRDP